MTFQQTKSDSIAFGLTVRGAGRHTFTRADYTPFFKKLDKLKIPIEYTFFERDKKGRSGVHLHGIIYLKKGFYRKRICTKGYNLKLEELYDRKGWLKYITKEQLNLDILEKIAQEEQDHQESDTEIDIDTNDNSLLEYLRDNKINLFI